MQVVMQLKSLHLWCHRGAHVGFSDFYFCFISNLRAAVEFLLLFPRQVRRMSSVVTRRREQRVLVMVITMVVCYLVCWLPYGVVALLATFGPRDLLTPEASITPSLLAKFSTVVNPFIYIFMNKQVSVLGDEGRCSVVCFCCDCGLLKVG